MLDVVLLLVSLFVREWP